MGCVTGFLGAFFCFCCTEIGAICGFKAIGVISPVGERNGRREAEGFGGFVGFTIVVFEAKAFIREETDVIVLLLTGFGVILFHVLDEVIVTGGHAVNVDLEEREEGDTVEVREDITATHTGAEVDTETAITLFRCADSTAITAVMVGEVPDGYFKALPIFVDVICDNVGVGIGILGGRGADVIVEPQREHSLGDGGTQEDHVTGKDIRPYIVFIHTGILALLHGGHLAGLQLIVFTILEPFYKVGADILPVMTDDDRDGGIDNGFTDGLPFSPASHFLLVEVQEITDGDEGFSAFKLACFKVADGLFTRKGVQSYPQDGYKDGDGDKGYYNPHDSLFSFSWGSRALTRAFSLSSSLLVKCRVTICARARMMNNTSISFFLLR